MQASKKKPQIGLFRNRKHKATFNVMLLRFLSFCVFTLGFCGFQIHLFSIYFRAPSSSVCWHSHLHTPVNSTCFDPVSFKDAGFCCCASISKARYNVVVSISLVQCRNYVSFRCFKTQTLWPFNFMIRGSFLVKHTVLSTVFPVRMLKVLRMIRNASFVLAAKTILDAGRCCCASKASC